MRYPCPCCGHLVFDEKPGSEDICLVCFWEDDLPQLRWPDLTQGANAVSLREAQKNYAECGAIEQRFAGDVRKAREDEPLDPEFRPIDDQDSFEGLEDSAPWPEDPTTLYYFRANFWRKKGAPPLEN
jgi:hypothetical protein